MTLQRMKPRITLCSLTVLMLAGLPALAAAEVMTFKVLSNSRATFKTTAILETVIGTTSGPAISGAVTGDLARPQAASGTVKVDLTTVKTGIDKRDADMRSKTYLDTDNEANRYAVFDLKGVEIADALEPGKEIPAKLRGTLTIKERLIDVTADAQVTYIKLTPEQLESQKRFGFASDNIRIIAKFNTSFTNHGMKVPELMYLKLSNDIVIETDLTLARQ